MGRGLGKHNGGNEKSCGAEKDDLRVKKTAEQIISACL